MKKLVIGGSGFVGSRLLSEVDRLDFKNFDKQQSPFFDNITSLGDIRDKEKLAKAMKGIDLVILLAAEHRDDVTPKSLYYDVNVQGTKNVLEAMDYCNVKKIIYTSSVAVYGLNKPNPNEKYQTDPFNDYGKSKLQAEKVLEKWFNKDSLNKSITVIRPTVIFGERNRGNVYNLLKQIISGKFIMIGKGDNKKSMAYVGNIVALIKSRLENNINGYHVFNYADKPDFSMNELTQLIEKKMNIKLSKIKLPYWLGMLCGYMFDLFSFIFKKKISISSVRVKKFCAATQFDASKVHNSFNAPYTLKEGLDKTLDYEFVNKKNKDVLFYTD